jgi:hypothetical protein
MFCWTHVQPNRVQTTSINYGTKYAGKRLCRGVTGGRQGCVVLKWESEEEIHAGLRKLTEDMRRLREELRNRGPSALRRAPSMPTEDERRLRPMQFEDADPNLNRR